MNPTSPLQIWWNEICARWRVYAVGLIAMLLTNGTEAMAPKTLQWMIDVLFALEKHSQSLNEVLRAVLIFFLVAIFGAVGRVLWRMTLARMTHVASKQIKGDIWNSIRSSSFDSLSRYTLGDLMNRSIADVNAARWIYGFTMVLTCDVFFFTVMGSISMILIDPIIACLCLATFIVIPPIAMRVAKLEFQAHDAAQSELTVLSENVGQAVRGIRSQRASQSFMSWIFALNDSALRYSKLRLRSQIIAINSFPIFSIPTILSYGIILTLGPSLVSEGKISIGAFAALASYVYLLQGPLGEIGDLVAEWQRGFASLRRISELQNLEPHRDKTQHHEKDHNNTLVISDLQMSRQGRVLFSDVSLALTRGEWVGIKGSVGSGKSTLLQAICGITPFDQGHVSIRSAAATEIRKDVVYAPEKPFIFSGTIRRNLSLNLIFTEEQLWDALRLVALDDYVLGIDGQLDGLVGEGGVTLSGGQRQRLALARVVLRANSLLVLDDPLSAVDSNTEAKIILSLRKRFAESSVIWASNKTSTLRCCDRIFQLSRDGLRLQPIDIATKSGITRLENAEVLCPAH